MHYLNANSVSVRDGYRIRLQPPRMLEPLPPEVVSR
jgi:hypothetical protein